MTLANQSFNVSAYISEGWARRKRLLNPPNAFKAPAAIQALKLVERAPERPLWRTQALSFDAHVLAYQWHLAHARANRAQEYIKARCIELGADYVKVTTKGRTTRDITGHRQLLMYELKTKFQLSYPRIGREFGVDHTTALHGVTRIAKIRGEERPEFVTGADRLLGDPALKQEVKDNYLCGMSVEALAEKFAISETAIVKVAKMENWHKPHRTFPNVRPPFAPVSADLVTMQIDYESGLLIREMVVKHQVSDSTIRRFIVKHGWKRAGAE